LEGAGLRELSGNAQDAFGIGVANATFGADGEEVFGHIADHFTFGENELPLGVNQALLIGGLGAREAIALRKRGLIAQVPSGRM